MDASLKLLHEASYDGDVNNLRHLLAEDPLLLDKELTEVRDNPLHIAALQGHVDFTSLLLRLNPELARRLNREGQSPLHLAAARGHLPVAKMLIDEVGSDICLISDSNQGYLPVHIATINGKHDIVKMLVQSRRDTLVMTTNKRETLLHLAVMDNSLDCVRYLIAQDVININEKDEEGYTCLHLAAAKRNRQMMTYLLGEEGIEINSRNAMGLTPLDILVVSSLGFVADISLVDKIRSAGGKRGTELSDLESNTDSSGVVGTHPTSKLRLMSKGNKNNTTYKENFSGNQTLLLVATLVATITFQAITNPPGGFIQPPFENNDIYKSTFLSNYKDRFLLGNSPHSSVSVILWLLIAEPKTKIIMKFLVAIVWFSAYCTALAFGSALLAIYAASVNDFFYSRDESQATQI